MKSFFKKTSSLLLALTMVVTCVAFPSAAFAKTFVSKSIPKDLEYAQGEAIVLLNDGCSSKIYSNVPKYFGSGITLNDSYEFDGSNEIGDLKIASFKSSSMTTQKLIKKLNSNPNVKVAFPNYKKHMESVTNDTYSAYQWALDNTGQNGGTVNADTNADALWSEAAASPKEQVVAIIDTGFDFTNEDLKDVVWQNPYGSKLTGKNGLDVSGSTKDGSPQDDDGHGSHCAGIIAASADNEKGISGINKSNVKIMPIRIFDDMGDAYDDDIFSAYEYVYRAIQLGTNVIATNNSFGGLGDELSKMLYEMIYDELGEAGCIQFIAAGNESTDIDFGEDDDFYDILLGDDYCVLPAGVDSKYKVTVAASNEKDELADFSNYGAKHVDVAAPGTDILSTVAYNCFNASLYDDSQRAALCSSYQDFESPLSAGEFGSVTTIPAFDSNSDYIPSSKISYTVSNDKYFGNEAGSSLAVTVDYTGKEKTAYFAIPYTLDNEDDDYSISLQGTGVTDGSCGACFVYDAPASVDFTDKDYYDYLFEINGFFVTKQNGSFWSHLFGDFAELDLLSDLEIYTKSKDRLLVFEVDTDKPVTIYIDNLAVSKQGVDASSFGKYDFYNGTSMATPYAIGAYALIRNARPDADVVAAKNMLINTGRHSASLDGKVKSGKVISLDAIDNVPPMIDDASYNADGNVEIEGSFKDVTSVKINGADATIVSSTNDKIVVKDNGYNARKLTIVVENAYGSDTFECVIANKALPDEDGLLAECSVLIPAGEVTYGIDDMGEIYELSSNDGDDDYNFDFLYGDVLETKPSVIDALPVGEIDEDVFDEDSSYIDITSATYTNNNIYFTADVVYASTNETVIGYDSMLVSYNLKTEDTKILCELPYNDAEGYTLASYNGSLYLIGGYDNSTSSFISDVYRYSSSTKSFSKSSTLATPVAYGSAIQYANKLVYMFGAKEDGKAPAPQTFDGTQWKQSNVKMDTISTPYEAKDNVKVYNGSVAIGNEGIICAGPFIEGIGNIYTYNVSKDALVESNYCLGDVDAEAVIASIPGRVFGIDILTGAVFTFEENTSFPEIIAKDSDYGYISTDEEVVMYGNKARVYVEPDYGYVPLKVTTTGSKKYDLKYSKTFDCYYADVVVNSKTFNVAMANSDYKLVKPAKVTGVKATANNNTTFTLTWKKPTRAQGYVIQEYKNSKWTNVKTIANADTLSHKVSSPKAGTHKYRVRAYAKYDGRTYYSDVSSAVSVYAPVKQTISSLKAGTKKFTVAYKKNTSATGYQIEYSTSSSFSGSKKVLVEKNATTSTTVSKLTAKKKYYVRVRSYKTVNGKKLYGAWSATKTVTTK